MNLLGLDGYYGRGFTTSEALPGEAERVEKMMKEIGEI